MLKGKFPSDLMNRNEKTRRNGCWHSANISLYSYMRPYRKKRPFCGDKTEYMFFLYRIVRLYSGYKSCRWYSRDLQCSGFRVPKIVYYYPPWHLVRDIWIYRCSWDSFHWPSRNLFPKGHVLYFSLRLIIEEWCGRIGFGRLNSFLGCLYWIWIYCWNALLHIRILKPGSFELCLRHPWQRHRDCACCWCWGRNFRRDWILPNMKGARGLGLKHRLQKCRFYMQNSSVLYSPV